MTIHEKKTVICALAEIMNADGDFSRGIAMLRKLADINDPAERILRNARRVYYSGSGAAP